MYYEHLVIVRGAVDKEGKFPRQLQHVLMRDGESWAALTIMPEGSPRETWCSEWFDRQAKELNAPRQPVTPASACTPGRLSL